MRNRTAVRLQSINLSIPVAATIWKLLGFTALDATALFANATESTWLAAGTFALTAGGVVKMIYQMKIDADKENALQELKAVREQLKLQEEQNKAIKSERTVLVAKMESDVRAATAESEAAKLAVVVAVARAEGTVKSIRDEIARLGEGHHSDSDALKDVMRSHEAMIADLKRRLETTEADHSGTSH